MEVIKTSLVSAITSIFAKCPQPHLNHISPQTYKHLKTKDILVQTRMYPPSNRCMELSIPLILTYRGHIEERDQ